MQINLNQKEVEIAIIDFISKSIPMDNKTIHVSLTTGRKGNGTTATINIDEDVPTPLHVAGEGSADELNLVEDGSIFNQG